ncbi:hypothetical protein NV379_05075 [Paenibacillus sp. N1-5-1-14]|uniref:hypothetical protein n=1 Tax=Paenibacillus radicibacter TaxID=2972488 RepID=UPI0021591C60|nr:hypothetical protein [Paenibacillus radicibacter]MCR8642023.1 hypothetical protein [Paenibacillus radicibacter]
MISLLLSILLNPSPKIIFSQDEIELYKGVLLTNKEELLIKYDFPYPKYRFLQYLSVQGQYVFHGSNNRNIDQFEPHEQTLYNGQLTKAVFASTDPIWAIFFAVFNRSRLIGSFRNGSIIAGKNRYHYFSLNDSTMNNKPWTEGVVYIFPRYKFNKSSQGKVHFDEWICDEPVTPVGKLAVNLSDFYYKNKVATHRDKESLLKTWLFYKARILFANSKKASEKESKS